MRKWLLPAAILVLAPACVSRGKYDDAVRSGEDARAQLQRITTLEQSETEARAALAAKLREQDALCQELGDQLAKLGKNADALVAERGSLASALQDSRARIDALRRAQSIVESRARDFHDLALRLKSMVDAGDLDIALRDGRMVLQLPNDVLFASGQVDVQPRGRAALKSVGAALKTLPDRRFQVAGHTDNVPIDSDRFPSNWELSTARGLEVTRVLISEGIKPSQLSATGYAEHDPIASNADGRGRARNRRIEITVQPNIDEIVAVPDLR